MAINYPRLGRGEGPGVLAELLSWEVAGPCLEAQGRVLAGLQRSDGIGIHYSWSSGRQAFWFIGNQQHKQQMPSSRAVHAGPDWNALLGLCRQSRAPQKKFPNSTQIKIFHFPLCNISLCPERQILPCWSLEVIFFFFFLSVTKSCLDNSGRKQTRPTRNRGCDKLQHW